MRADRLVTVLLLLQARGRLTAPQLAAELEVSVKTARRDLEALAVAGIPVYAQPGRGGGWQLLGGARTDLSGLTAGEARALFLVAGPSTPLAPAARSALRKLVRALPETFRNDAERAASAVILDPARWGESAPSGEVHLETLQRAVIDERQVRLRYVDRQRNETERQVHPLGLVQKGLAWYLVASTDGGLRTFRLSRIRSVEITDEPAVRPEGFDLAAAWRSEAAVVERRRATVRATVRTDERVLEPLTALFGRELELLRREAAGRAVVEISGPSARVIAERLAGWGGLLEVLGPDEVRADLARIGAELVGRYGDGSPARVAGGDATA